MVKELIKGILGKNDAGAQAAPPAGEEPPDELPPLAEDVAAQAPSDAPPSDAPPAELPAIDAAPAAEPAAAPEPVAEPAPEPAQADAPAELPELSVAPDADQAAPPAPPAELPEALPEAPGQAPADQPAASQAPADQHHVPEEIKRAKEQQTKQEPPARISDDTALTSSSSEPDMGPSFFSSILTHLKKQEGYQDKLLSGDLFSRMNNYWELKKDHEGSTKPLSREHALEENMVKTLESLKTLEHKWQIQKLALDADLHYLQQRESEIRNKMQELNQIRNELLLFKQVKPDHYFLLQNGVILKNLHDLIDVLEIMDDQTYRHHVGHSHNDFAIWIQHVYKDPHLAHKVQRARSRIEMIQTIQMTPLASPTLGLKAKQVNPSQYFFLKNNAVVKSLTELQDALKAMDEDVFRYHVTTDRNDFADWIKRVFEDDVLANAVRKCHTRLQMVDAIDVHH